MNCIYTLNLLRLALRSCTDLSLCRQAHENSFTIARRPGKRTKHYKIQINFRSDEGPMLETLDHTIRIDSTPTFLYYKIQTTY